MLIGDLSSNASGRYRCIEQFYKSFLFCSLTPDNQCGTVYGCFLGSCEISLTKFVSAEASTSRIYLSGHVPLR
jgi:hypothetical protein